MLIQIKARQLSIGRVFSPGQSVLPTTAAIASGYRNRVRLALNVCSFAIGPRPRICDFLGRASISSNGALLALGIVLTPRMLKYSKIPIF
jgi:hypothetical protein